MSLDGYLTYGTDELDNVPDTPGIYVILTKEYDVLYVGRASRLKSRLKQHLIYSGRQRFAPLADLVRIKRMHTRELVASEAMQIRSLRPIFNEAQTDYESFYSKLHGEDFNPADLQSMLYEWRARESGDFCISSGGELNMTGTTPDNGSYGMIGISELYDLLDSRQRKIATIRQAIKSLKETVTDERIKGLMTEELERIMSEAV